jgi:hypothetical protein
VDRGPAGFVDAHGDHETGEAPTTQMATRMDRRVTMVRATNGQARLLR